MTGVVNELPRMTDEIDITTSSLLEYKQYEQENINGYLGRVFAIGKIDADFYKEMMLETCEETDWGPTFEHFKSVWDRVGDRVREAEAEIISARIIKGAQMIDLERDPVRRRKMLRVYDELLLKLNA